MTFVEVHVLHAGENRAVDIFVSLKVRVLFQSAALSPPCSPDVTPHILMFRLLKRSRFKLKMTVNEGFLRLRLLPELPDGLRLCLTFKDSNVEPSLLQNQVGNQEHPMSFTGNEIQNSKAEPVLISLLMWTWSNPN